MRIGELLKLLIVFHVRSLRPSSDVSVFLTLHEFFQSSDFLNVQEGVDEVLQVIKVVLEIKHVVLDETLDELCSHFGQFVSVLIIFRSLLNIFHHEEHIGQSDVMWDLDQFMNSGKCVN